MRYWEVSGKVAVAPSWEPHPLFPRQPPLLTWLL